MKLRTRPNRRRAQNRRKTAPPAHRAAAPVRGPADRRLRTLVLLLVVFGLVMVYSASSVLALAQNGSSTVFFRSQAFKAILGVAAMLIVSRLDYRLWMKFSKPLVWIVLVMLFFLALPVETRWAPEINGAQRWIALPGLTFQPIELAKLALIVWMAATIVRKGSKLTEGWDPLVPLLTLPAVMGLLVLLQPDFKGAAMLGVLAFALLLLAGVRWRYLAGVGATGIPLAGLIMVLEPYRVKRLLAYFDPGRDVEGITYQINQSLISLGSGGWLGVGLGSSKQKFAFLPMAHTDFIASIVGEELGIFGTLGLLAAFLYLGALGYRIAKRAPDRFGFLIASGLTTLLVASAMMNLGVATAVLPTTGLPLPFVSYGGTALIVHLVSVGILLSVSRDGIDPPKPRGAARSSRFKWRKGKPGGRS